MSHKNVLTKNSPQNPKCKKSIICFPNTEFPKGLRIHHLGKFPNNPLCVYCRVIQRTIHQNIQPTRTGSHPVHNQPFSCPTSSSRILIQRKSSGVRPPTVGTQLVGDSPDPILLTYRPISLLSSPLQLNAKHNPSQVLINIGDSLEPNRSHVIANFFCAQSIAFFREHCNQAQPTCIS